MSVSLGWIAPLFHTLKKRPLCRRRETRASWLSYYRAVVMLRGRTFTYGTGSPEMLSARSCTVKGSGLVYIFLSTIISLSSEIACDGFSPFGQALAQFIMVWQR